MWKTLHSERSRRAITYQCRTLIIIIFSYFFYLFSPKWRNHFHNSAPAWVRLSGVYKSHIRSRLRNGRYLGFGAIRASLAKIAQPPMAMKASAFICPCQFFVRIILDFAMLYIWNYRSSNLFEKRGIQSWAGRTFRMVLFLRIQIFERT